jgi:hypothetical protein
MALQQSMQFSEKFSVVLEKNMLDLFRTFHFKIWHALSLADRTRIVPDSSITRD